MHQTNWKGLLLRSERIRQNKGQKEICIGCCVTSYLSKIERGLAEPAEELLAELFRRLDIHYETDPAFLAEAQAITEEIFRRILYGLNYEEPMRELIAEESRLLYSPLRIDYLLVRSFLHEPLTNNQECLELLQEMTYGMTDRQLGYYHILEGNTATDAALSLSHYKEAARLLPHSYTMLLTARGYLYTSNYTAVHNMEQRLVTTALEEGNVYTMAQYYFLNGTAYGSLDLTEMMLLYYDRAIRMFENTGWKKILDDIYYNIGSVYLSLQRLDKADRYLKLVKEESFLLFHKKALLEIRRGDPEKAMKYLKQMQAYLTTAQNPTYDILYREACKETEENHLEDPAYEELLDQLIVILEKHAHFGYLYFFRDIITQTYTARRKYKKALDFQSKLSGKLTNP